MQLKNLVSTIDAHTKILLLIIIISFMLTCILSFIAINALKYEYDSNFLTHTKEIEILHETQFFYPLQSEARREDVNIKQTLRQSSKPSLFLTLHTLYQKIFLPQSYQKLQELYQQEDRLVESFYVQVESLDHLITKYAKNFSSQLLDKLREKNQDIKHILSSLLDMRLQIAANQKQTIHSIYEVTCILLFIFVAIVFLTTIILARNVLAAINLQKKELKKTIREKTLELKNINANLTKTIENEVESSRKKDQIMYQQDRLASMGEMIQNIAHQWRQPLNSLMIIIQSFKIKYYNQKLDSAFIDSQTEYGLKIAKNMSETIENFRHFFQPNKLKEFFSLKGSIMDSIHLIDFVLKQNNITILVSLKDDCQFYGYKNAFSQVILNLLKNAQDAIIERKIKEGFCQIILEKQSDKILISLKDNAGGIKEKRIDKIFEPYFTTKHKSVGTGIGLFMTKEIIEKQMQGSIYGTNTQWQHKDSTFYGAMFVIELPCSNKQKRGEKNGKREV